MPEAATASRLIEQIETRFHEGHRRAFTQLRALAGALPAHAPEQALAVALRRLFDALEQHMFKEEMRLFPMMQQGGNRLITQLIDDLHADHDDHAAAMAALGLQLQALAADPARTAALQPLRQGLQALAGELALHIQAEEEQLFPMFLPPGHAGAGRHAAGVPSPRPINRTPP
jgi:regulator of cell morphogenesis and NO signaling